MADFGFQGKVTPGRVGKKGARSAIARWPRPRPALTGSVSLPDSPVRSPAAGVWIVSSPFPATNEAFRNRLGSASWCTPWEFLLAPNLAEDKPVLGFTGLSQGRWHMSVILPRHARHPSRGGGASRQVSAKASGREWNLRANRPTIQRAKSSLLLSGCLSPAAGVRYDAASSAP